MDGKYINSEALCKHLRKWYEGKTDNAIVMSEDVISEIEKFPAADVVSVVRCKDCANSHPDIFKERLECEITNCRVRHIDFCGRGVKKKGCSKW